MLPEFNQFVKTLPEYSKRITHSVKEPVYWLSIAVVIGIVTGCAIALFLIGLEWVTTTREAHPWLITLLPVAGLVSGLAYWRFGTKVESGNNLILDEIHDSKELIPRRMAPMILLATWLTHLFGGSAGREGTGVQMGGGLADQLSRYLKFDADNRKVVLTAGLAAGFSAVFGTPLAGAIFGIEVLAVGRLRSDSFYAALVASLIAHHTCQLFGIQHEVYRVGIVPGFTGPVLLWALLAGVAFGIVARIFATSMEGFHEFTRKKIRWAPLRPFFGGLLVTAGVLLFHHWRFIGLGDDITRSALSGNPQGLNWIGKLIYTVVTLGSGFKGGEVTPLFFIGSTFGQQLSLIIPLPATTLAALGFVAVFAGASNAPLASTLLAIELFGLEIGWMAAVACVGSYLFSGEAGIYTSQRHETKKRRVSTQEMRIKD